ncbi:hypothetical protein [Streptomyces sp. NPDC005438]|uniref:hypothetical protein n=1 Tax=Streptomyces sp. NPDC005438 TaxID=3156880 RepID=UPI0033B7E3DC
MDLDALRFARFGSLETAIEDWAATVRKLKALEKDAKRSLEKKALAADWSGENASVTREFVVRTTGEFADGVREARSIHNILKDARSELVRYKSQLEKALEDGQKKNLTVLSNRDGGFTVTMNVHPDSTTKDVASHGQKDADALRDRIEKILKGATETDTTAARALRMIANHSPVGFSHVPTYKDRDQAAKSLKDAETALKLANKGGANLDDKELTRLNGLLKANRQDPLFSETFATRMGPKKTLQLYADLADVRWFYGDRQGRREQVKQFQKNLGLTLGTATRSDSAAMEKWEHRMVDLGPKELDTDRSSQPRGFQVMSNLMRFGKYDTEFLNRYGEDLLEMDKEENKVRRLSPWQSTGHATLNFWGKHDRGADPVNGFLEGLGHNPEASTQFFNRPANPDPENPGIDSKKDLNEHLKYLTKERHFGTVFGSSEEEKVGYRSLGHALEAASTGHPWDFIPTSSDGKPELPPGYSDHRTADTASVMEQLVHMYKGVDGQKLMESNEGIAPSLGRIGAAYMDDVNYSLTGNEDLFGTKYEGRHRIDSSDMKYFLETLGGDKSAYSTMSQAQSMYTAGVLAANPGDTEAGFRNGEEALRSTARVFGILDRSMHENLAEEYRENAKKVNEEMERLGEWKKSAVVSSTAVAAGLITAPISSGTAAVVAPLAAEVGKEVFNTFLEPRVTDTDEMEPSDDIRKAAEKADARATETLRRIWEKYCNESDWDDSEQGESEITDVYNNFGPKGRYGGD